MAANGDPESEPFGRLPAGDDEDGPTPGDPDRDDDSDLHAADEGEGGRRRANDANHTALPPKVEAWRKRSATGAMLTGFALGLQQVFGQGAGGARHRHADLGRPAPGPARSKPKWSRAGPARASSTSGPGCCPSAPRPATTAGGRRPWTDRRRRTTDDPGAEDA